MKKHCKSCDLWILISSENKDERMRKQLINQMDEKQMDRIGDLMQDLLDGNLRLPDDVLRQLARDKEDIRDIERLANKKVAVKRRKKILRQKGGFLQLLAPLLIPAAAGPIFKFIGEKIANAFKKKKKKQ